MTGSFIAALKKFQEQTVPKAYRAANKEAAQALLARIKELTPVDTGKTREAWRMEEQPDGSFIISNPLPHAVALEHGSSSQAPNGMVELAITELAVLKG